jgi:hypothetical protein
MATRYQRGNQKPQIKERRTDNTMATRRPFSFDHYVFCPSFFNVRFLDTSLVYCGHYVVCPSFFDLRFLVTILSHNVVSKTPRLSRIRTHNFSGDRY